MRNLMTLRGVRTLALAAALGAACGGGNPPGGGNGDTDGGGTTDGTTGNGGRNPLIDAIPGCWEIVSINCELEDDHPISVTVDPNDPACGDVGGQNLPGDACIDWFHTSGSLVLDGDVIRYRNDQQRSSGHVLEDGHRIVYTYEECPGYQVPCEVEPTRRDEIDARWVRPIDPEAPEGCDTGQPPENAEPRCTPEGGGAP